LVGFDDVVSKILWSKLFIEAQGFEVKANIVYQEQQYQLYVIGREMVKRALESTHIISISSSSTLPT
jgi:hypothetical protein